VKGGQAIRRHRRIGFPGSKNGKHVSISTHDFWHGWASTNRQLSPYFYKRTQSNKLTGVDEHHVVTEAMAITARRAVERISTFKYEKTRTKQLAKPESPGADR